jgi:iron(III) transport system ATP-binding protein
MTVSVHLERVTKRHRRATRPALDAVTLECAAGRVLVLLGASGAGKTTLLRVVAGFESGDEGTVRLDGRIVSDPRIVVPPERRGVGMVFQDLALWPHLTVAEHVAFGLPGRPRRSAAERNAVVRTLAERLHVESLLARRPGTLSGGERQRVAIARALAPRPAVLLYDEPLANLDPTRRADVRSLIRELCREQGTTLLYVTHDAEDAMEMGDEIAVLVAGRVVERGTPHALWTEPRTLEGARALGAVNEVRGVMERGRLVTALGPVAPRGRALPEGTAGTALVRPESVLVGEGGASAEVLEVRAHRAGWAVVARAGDGLVRGVAPERAPVVGTSVGLRVAGPAPVLAEPAAAPEAA